MSAQIWLVHVHLSLRAFIIQISFAVMCRFSKVHLDDFLVLCKCLCKLRLADFSLFVRQLGLGCWTRSITLIFALVRCRAKHLRAVLDEVRGRGLLVMNLLLNFKWNGFLDASWCCLKLNQMRLLYSLVYCHSHQHFFIAQKLSHLVL